MLSMCVALVAPAFPLTVESIMRGPALVGHAPRGLQWSEDGSELQFQWAKADGSTDPSYRTYTVKSDGTGLKQGAMSPGRPNSNLSNRVYASNGDIYFYDVGLKAARALTTTQDFESSPQLVADGKAVIYTRQGNLYRVDLSNGSTIQLTNIHPEVTLSPPPIAPPLNDSQKALQEEQSILFKDFPRSGRFGGGPVGAGNFGGGEALPANIEVPKGWLAGSTSVSPSGKFAALQFFYQPQGVRIAQVPNYVTRSGYTEEIPTYEKVGDAQGRSTTLLIDLTTGKKIDVSVPRSAISFGFSWSPDGSHGASWITAEDHKDAWLVAFDAATTTSKILWTEHDDAWVGGPGQGALGWLPNGRLYFESEKTGFAHLMTMAADGSDVQALTSGEFEVSNVTLDVRNERFVFVSSEGSPFLRHVDVMPFSGGKASKMADLSADDDAAFAISPNGTDVAVVRSSSNRPAELFVSGKQVTTTPTEEWLSGPWTVPPIVRVPARDGVGVPAHLYRPKSWKRGGPAVIFVHGAGYLQNVYEGWSYYYREYMFNHLLMSRGYAVLDMDYRGSAGYGSLWRTAIYRHMGGKDLDDQVDGAHYLVRELGVDPKRIGLYGGSYGGFITLMAMFKAPDVFSAGAALRPVSDWANYNHGYTSEILNLPQDDATAYKQSSPIYFAEGLKGALLICHGMVDTNVHFQDSVRLAQRLIDLGKTNWEIAPYPTEDHSFRKAESWTDEYRRILALFESSIGKKG